MAIWPNTAEQVHLKFVIPKMSFWVRYGLAAVLFTVGLTVNFQAGHYWNPMFLPLILLGHLPLWVHRQDLNPSREDRDEDVVWAPAEPDWFQFVGEMKVRAKKWDLSYWDITSPLSRGTMCGLGLCLVLLFFMVGSVLGFEGNPLVTIVLCMVALWLPMFFNGRREDWAPWSGLNSRAEALEPIAGLAERYSPDDYDLIWLLGMKTARKGRYPSDVRIMLRPKIDDGSGFIGVQVQVSINRGKPYVYCVVLGKPGFRISDKSTRMKPKLVVEAGEGEGVSYIVVRRHATKTTGTHTPPKVVKKIVKVALDRARNARESNAPSLEPS